MVSAYLILLLVIGVERLVELAISRRHAAAALRQGGIEYGQRHFRWMKLLHGTFLLSCAAEVVLLGRPFDPVLGTTMFPLVIASQALRYWAIASLGSAWNVRVIVVPGSRIVTSGPYRFLRHPNYLAVIVEGVAIPLVHGAWITALVFTVLNALLLRIRIRCEEEALARHCSDADQLGGRPRLVPSLATSGREVAE